MKGVLRKIHRWLGLLMVLPILAWMLSGFWFAFNPIGKIRGEHLTRPAEVLDLDPTSANPGAALPPAWAAGLAGEFGADWSLSAVQLIRRDGHLAWRLSGTADGQAFTRLVDLTTGQFYPRMTADDAKRAALRSLIVPGTVLAVEWVAEVAPGDEVRGRNLPLWRVRFSEPESLSLYLDPWTGEIAARRTANWRIFDFLWMLHILDFEAREDFNHPLLQGAALFGLVVALSGVLLWFLTTSLRRRRSRA